MSVFKNFLFLFFAPDTVFYIAAALIAVAALGIGVFGGYLIFKRLTKKELGNVKEYVKKLKEDAANESKALKKEALIEAKEQDLKLRNEFEREKKEKNAELVKMEQRLIQKEDALDKKDDLLTKKTEQAEEMKKNLAARDVKTSELQEDLKKQRELISKEIEKAAQMSREDAKKYLISQIEEDAKKDAAILVRNIEQQAKDEAEKKAKGIISLAIQRCATDHASEMTISVVPIANDDIKGRIIGREGRNIRAIENATGVDLIIDDTPEVITLSGFDPVRREIARISLEKLIADGRIHPARIEEVVEKVRKEVDVQIKEAGEAAMLDAGLFGLHFEIIKLLGRLKFRTSYGQNVLQHSMEVAYLAGIMASELGVDVTMAKRAGLLHDIGKAVDHETEGTHIQIGADLAKKYKENNSIINAIAAHHGDVEPLTVEAVLVQAADAISGARPGARRETLENYVKRLKKLEEIAVSYDGVDKCYAIKAGREVRILVKPEQVNDDTTIFLAKEIAKKIEQELDYPGQIKVNVIREWRGVEYAK